MVARGERDGNQPPKSFVASKDKQEDPSEPNPLLD
jgi:hypothetical protein